MTKSQMLPGSCSKLQQHVLSCCLPLVSSVATWSLLVIKKCDGSVIKSAFSLPLSCYPLLLSIPSGLATYQGGWYPRFPLPRSWWGQQEPVRRWLHLFSAAQQCLPGFACLPVMALRQRGRPNLLILGKLKRKLISKMLSSDKKAVIHIWYIQ